MYASNLDLYGLRSIAVRMRVRVSRVRMRVRVAARGAVDPIWLCTLEYSSARKLNTPEYSSRMYMYMSHPWLKEGPKVKIFKIFKNVKFGPN